MKKFLVISGAIVILILALLTGANALLKGGKMKVSTNEDLITLSSGLSNVDLIKGKDGYALVDTGMEKEGKPLISFLESRGIAFSEIKSHAHADHMGGMAHLKNLTGAKLLCHKNNETLIVL